MVVKGLGVTCSVAKAAASLCARAASCLRVSSLAALVFCGCGDVGRRRRLSAEDARRMPLDSSPSDGRLSAAKRPAEMAELTFSACCSAR